MFSTRHARRRKLAPTAAGFASMVLLSACVTINVYFPAAEAKEAAKEFVEKVIGDELPNGVKPEAKPEESKPEADNKPNGGGMASLLRRIDPLSLVGIGTAHAQAQPDITIKTPAIQAIQARMASRFDATLRKGFDMGALGFSKDGLVVLRDPGSLELKDRVGMQKAVADDNRDRAAVYKEIAVANGHPDWEKNIRTVFAKQWVDSARGGWWYQDASGAWKQK
ncbi:YdbL family protein [Lysobacter sp. A6]|uniref:YdbL family protein n=1 Tax=Noviluteimonas lactosilytica TaxID=2888523 RepID=A0ABS8JET8_9GAMM|nr:YdbL family protein [Lysobacter lactosilyticus]MCC8362025.1 YdbL family protein [Lysobacter lactosilyticus]